MNADNNDTGSHAVVRVLHSSALVTLTEMNI